MATLKLSMDYDCDFKLIGLHSSLSDYRLAYFLNKELQLQLHREDKKKVLECPINSGYYSYYTWQHPISDIKWHCIGNKLRVEREMNKAGLFESTYAMQYLIASLKKVDYFLKIDTDGYLDTAKLISQTNSIPSTTAYIIEPNTLSLKHKLLFQEC